MIWKYRDTVVDWTPQKYWHAKKKGATIRIEGDDEQGYWFFVRREKDGWVYNSLWQSHPNPNAPLIRKRMKVSLEEMKRFVEEWVDKYVPATPKFVD